MEIAAVVLLVSLVAKVTDFLKFLRAKDYGPVTTQAIAWASGVVCVFLFAYSDFGSEIDVNGRILSDLGTVSLLIVGLSASSLASVGKDALSALDNTRSNKTA